MKVNWKICFLLAYALITPAPVICSEELEKEAPLVRIKNKNSIPVENMIVGTGLIVSGSLSFFLRNAVALATDELQPPSIHPLETAAISSGMLLLIFGLTKRGESQKE